jgi:beta-barrel assembly-enhancing protease
MNRSWVLQTTSAALAVLLIAPPGFSLPQQQGQSQTPSSSPTSSQPQPSQTATGPASSTGESPADSTVEGGAPKANIKPGSEADVNAIGNRNVGKGLDFYSMEHEIAIGKQLSQEVEKSAKFIDDPVVTEYVNRVGQNLVRNSDARVPFTIKVIDSDQVNAFALPGGFFYVNSGLILHADEESELAGVMAHEIAHVCARHGTKQQTKGDIVQLASIPAMIFIPYSWAGYALYEGINLAIPMTFLKFSRDDEKEADYLGLQYMYKAGYDPNSFVSFFEKVEALEKKQPGTIPKYFATHPPTPDRIEAAQKEIADILPPRNEYIVTTSEFDMVKRRLQMIEMNEKVTNGKKGGPTLRNKTKNPTANGGSNGGSTDDSDDSGRPTLKRRPDDQSQDPSQSQPQSQP